MEETKGNFICKKFGCLNIWWIKSLVTFIILLAIFCAGVSFGEHHGNFRAMRGGDVRANMFGSQRQNNGMMPGNFGRQGKRLNNGGVVPTQPTNLNQNQTSTQTTNPITQ